MSSPGLSGVPVGVNGVPCISIPYVVPAGKSVSIVVDQLVAIGPVIASPSTAKEPENMSNASPVTVTCIVPICVPAMVSDTVMSYIPGYVIITPPVNICVPLSDHVN